MIDLSNDFIEPRDAGMNLVELPVSKELEELSSGALLSRGDSYEMDEPKSMGRRTLAGR